MELVLHVAALLVVEEDEAAIGPQVEPVPLPAAQDGAFQREYESIRVSEASPNTHKLLSRVGILTLSMEPTALHHGHRRADP